MPDIFVNTIINDNGIEHGIVGDDTTVFRNLNVIYEGDQLKNLLALINSKPKDPFYFFDKFCQFIVYFQYQPLLGLSMKFTDFQNNDDLALDNYLNLKEKDWLQSDREKIMKLHTEIKDSKSNKANLVVQEIGFPNL